MSDEENEQEPEPEQESNVVRDNERIGLVSYLDDDEEEEEITQPESEKETTEVNDIQDIQVDQVDVIEGETESLVEPKPKEIIVKMEVGDTEEVCLPHEPSDQCSFELQEKVEKTIRRMQYDLSFDLNKTIQDNKAFRNPSIYEKLISFLGINEKGTNYPKDRFDPARYPPSSYYEELAKTQQKELDRLEKLKKEQLQRKLSEGIAELHHSASDSKLLSSSDSLANSSLTSGFPTNKKRSKWDNSPSSQHSSDASKKTVIPAVGSLSRIKK
ncbi:SAP30-binding protein [Cichlidogyrus casuarinus]|uniref:SAP30-binding protein n=1 Tax=Cichlidogyrus casuarinus TaxID=1844966 RepID=A0ABD2Q0T0_9PLAT